MTIKKDVEPIAEYVAAAGRGYGWVKMWRVGDRYVVQWGNDAYANEEISESALDEDDLAALLEDDSLRGLDAIVQTANIRGADAVPEANETSEGPFYILETRYWYGVTEASRLVMDERGREPLEFASLEEARKWIERVGSEIYYLAYNEYQRPTYKVIAGNRHF